MKKSIQNMLWPVLLFTLTALIAVCPVRVSADPDESGQEHVHEFSVYGWDENDHWLKCPEDGEIDPASVTNHTFVQKSDSTHHYEECSVCGYQRNREAHTYEWTNDDNEHWQVCTFCGAETAKEAHVPGPEATEKDPQLCTVCGFILEGVKNRYEVRIHFESNDYLDFKDEKDYQAGGTKLYYALEGENVEVLVTDPEAPSIEIVESILFYDQETQLLLDSDKGYKSEILVDGRTIVYFEMPPMDIIIQANLVVSEEKALESSIEESLSIEESIKEDEWIKESIAAEKRFRYGSYLVETDTSEVTSPKNFVRAKDVQNFERSVGCFYSTDYRIFVYYASKDEVRYDFYVLDKIGHDLIPFVSFPGTGTASYVVSAPESEKDIPGIYRQEVSVELKFASASDSVAVPAFLIIDENNDTLKLLYLNDSTGNQQFFVYEDSNGTVELTEYERYREKKKNGGDDDDKIVITTEAPERSNEPVRNGGLSRTAIWLIIGGVIILLAAAALTAVFVMSRRQEAKEKELDEDDEPLGLVETEEEPLIPEEDDELPETFDTSLYKNPDPTDLTNGKEAAEFDFENAFPGMKPAATAAVSAAEKGTPDPETAAENAGKADRPETDGSSGNGEPPGAKAEPKGTSPVNGVGKLEFEDIQDL